MVRKRNVGRGGCLPLLTNWMPLTILSLLCELNWRLEKTLNPLWVEQVQNASAIVEKYNPFPHILELPTAAIRPDRTESASLDWAAITDQWVDLCFLLARSACEGQDEALFSTWVERLKTIAPQKAEWRVRLAHVECIYHLSSFDLAKARESLQAWPESDDLPFWNARRASILAELGDLKEAHRIAKSALSGIRSRLKTRCI